MTRKAIKKNFQKKNAARFVFFAIFFEISAFLEKKEFWHSEILDPELI